MRCPPTLETIGNLLGGYVEQLFASLSLVDHFEALSRGLVELRSLVFFFLFTIGWLASGMLVLDRTRAT